MSQTVMGEYYYYGEGVEKNYAKPIKWFTKSANQGSLKALIDLVRCY